MEDDILIDNYLKGLLSKDEETSFLERLESDIEFKEKFKLEEQLFNALNKDNWSFVERENSEFKEYTKLLKDDDLQNLKKTLANTNAEFNFKKDLSSRRLFYYLAAASIVLFLGFQFFFNQSISNQDLYNDYVALNDLPSFVSRGNVSDDLVKAQSLFEDKKYEDALSIFKSQINASANKANVYIYQGIAQTELGQFDEAEKTFNTLINSESLDAEKGYWYKALSLLKADKVEEAKKLLEYIISKSLHNHKKAKQLLDEL